jgi:hypothetical protein
MKTTPRLLALALALVASTLTATAQTRVNGYTRKDGTYVAPYTRSDSNSTVRDNWSYRGNTNPSTGETGSSYYRSSPSSEYYNGGAYKANESRYYRLGR